MHNLESFAGIAPMPVDPTLDVFEEVYKDNALVMQTKKVYEYGAGGWNFQYRYMLRILDWSKTLPICSPASDPENGYMAELFVVPVPESLNAEAREDVISGAGEDEIDCFSLLSNDYYVRVGWTKGLMAIDNVKDGEEEGFNEADIPATITLVSNVVDIVDANLGFYLDKPCNRIGDTGWDLLENMIKQ